MIGNSPIGNQIIGNTRIIEYTRIFNPIDVDLTATASYIEWESEGGVEIYTALSDTEPTSWNKATNREPITNAEGAINTKLWVRVYMYGENPKLFSLNAVIVELLDGEEFIVQEVRMKLRNHKDGVYSVKLATTRTLGIIQVLQNLLKTEQRILTRDQEQEPLLTFRQTADDFEIGDSLQTSTEWVITSPPYTWEAATGDTETNPIVWNFFTWSA